MLNSKPIHFFLISKIDFNKNINKLKKNFLYFYQSYIDIYI